MVQTALRALPTVSTSFHIEGVRVDAVFQEVYDVLRFRAAALGVRLRFDIIEWEPLRAAADPGALREILQTSALAAMNQPWVSVVTMRAYPCQDDVCVLFEVLDDRPKTVDSGFPWSADLEQPRRMIERLGGEFGTYWREEGGAGLHFWLPQWV